MTGKPNYNDGNWHRWNGGECPVHPESLVDAVWHDENLLTTGIRQGRAFGGAWRNQILKFRVTKEHRESRECWSYGARIHNAEAEAVAFRQSVADANPGKGYEDEPITKWREVLE